MPLRSLLLSCLFASLLAGAALPAQAQRFDREGGLRALLEERGAAARVPAGVRRIADVPYGSDARQRMDVYLPATRTAGAAPAPVVFMVHGGGWRTGDKAMARVVQEKVARWVPRGMVFVSVNYRLLPEADVGQQARDVAAALAAAQQRAAGWGADGSRVVLMGHSAGAHLVALLNARPALAQREGAAPWLGAVALDSAVLNVPAFMAAPHVRLYDQAFGSDPATWAALSPYDQLAPGAPPFLLVCSTQRPDRPCLQADAMARHVRAQGARAEVLPQALSHADVNGTLGLESDYTRAVEAFMASLDAQVAAMLGR